MSLNILCIGDVVGKPGRCILSQALPELVRRYDLHCVIADVENASGGSGLTPQVYEKFLHYGCDVLTMGDHVYKRQEIIPVLSQSDRIVRPANLPVGAPGRPYVVHQTKSGHKVAVVTLLGRLYMNVSVDCPFRTIDGILAKLPQDLNAVIVEYHGEATSEKIAMGWHLDGRVSVVFGTHTHVPTADAAILPRGTAYITDVGMTGPHDSVLGRRKDRVLRTLITAIPTRFDVAEGDPRVNGIVVRIDPTTSRAQSIERITVDQTQVPDRDKQQSFEESTS